MEEESTEGPDLFTPLLRSLSKEEDAEAEEISEDANQQDKHKDKKRSFFGESFLPGFFGEKNLIEKSKKRLQKDEKNAPSQTPKLPEEEELNIPAFLRR